MRIDKPSSFYLVPWAEIKKKDNCKIKQRKGSTESPSKLKTLSVHWGNFMVQRFLEAAHKYICVCIYLCLYFICPPFYFCFPVFPDCAGTRGSSSWVCNVCCKGREIGESPTDSHLFFRLPCPPEMGVGGSADDYSLCIQNLFCKQSNAITNKLDFVPMFAPPSPLCAATHCCTAILGEIAQESAVMIEGICD